MTQLSLCIATKNLTFYRFLEIKFFLLFGAHELDVLNKHAKVCCAGGLVGVANHVMDLMSFVAPA